MAIIYKKGSKDLEYTGIDKAFKGFGDALETIKSAPKRALDNFEGKLKQMDEAKRKRNTQMIERTFGSVENYNKFNRQSK